MSAQSLIYLHFDFSEGEAGSGSFDALASVPPRALQALHTELRAVLGWAYAAFPGGRGPLEDGGRWDYVLQGTCERSLSQHLDFDEDAGTLSVHASGSPEALRHTVALSLVGDAAFCAALRAAFDWEGE